MNNYLDIYKNFNAKAKKAEHNGNFKEAKMSYILAGETLLEFAMTQKGDTHRQFRREAEDIISYANRLPAHLSIVSKSGSGSTASPPTITPSKKPFVPMQRDDDENQVHKFVPICSDEIKIGFDDIAGMTEVKEELKTTMIQAVKYVDLFSEYGEIESSGMLLIGPPGNGKTTLAKAAAKEIDAAFFEIKPSDILDKYVGCSEKNVKALFEAARSYPRSILFFDDMDGLFKARGKSVIADKLLTELLIQMQGFKEHGNMTLYIGATNMPWSVDPAAIRRFGTQIYVPLPDFAARKYLIRKKLEPIIPLDSRINIYDDNDEFIIELAYLTEGFSGDDITKICKGCTIPAKKRASAVRDRNGSLEEENAVKKVAIEDIKNTLANFRSSVRKEDIKRIEKYMNSLGSCSIDGF